MQKKHAHARALALTLAVGFFVFFLIQLVHAVSDEA
jgi:hypothetical protein